MGVTLPRSSRRGNAGPLLLLLAIAGLASAASALNYTVGGTNAWRRPPASDPNYFEQWAAQYTFTIADFLRFDSMGENHNVLYLRQRTNDFLACNVTDPSGGGDTYSTPVTVSFDGPGNFYFTSSVAGDCAAGLKVLITIASGSGGGAPGAPPPSTPRLSPPLAGSPPTTTPTSAPQSPPTAASPSPPTAAAPSPPTAAAPSPPTAAAPPRSSTPPPAGGGNVPGPAPVLYLFVVGDGEGWKRPATSTFYNDWAAPYQPFYQASDILEFDYDNATHNVVVLDSTQYSTCNTQTPLTNFSSGSDQLQPSAPGTYYLSSSFPGDCAAGIKLQVTYIAGSRPAPPPGPPSGPASSPPSLSPPLARPPSPQALPPPPVTPGGPAAQGPAPPTTGGPAQEPSPPTTLPPPPGGLPPSTTLAPPPPPLSASPPPPPPRTPPPPAARTPPPPPSLTIPPGLVPPGLSLPPGILAPPSPSAATPGAVAGTSAFVAALGLSLLFLM